MSGSLIKFPSALSGEPANESTHAHQNFFSILMAAFK
jgi:hypothetical protein